MKILTLILVVLVVALTIISCKKDKSNSDSVSIDPVDKVISVAEDGVPMLIGTYTRKEGHVDGKAGGIHLAYLKDGKVTYVKTIPAGINPSYIDIHPGKPYVYVVNEIGSGKGETTGAITALSYDNEFNFSRINARLAKGAHSCHVSVNKQGTHVLTANYSGGDIAMYPLALDGRTGGPGYNEIVFKGSGPDARQKSPHLHYIEEGHGGLIYAADLGTDSIYVFSTQNGVLKRHTHSIKVSAGAGPRHLTFHPTQPWIFIVNEINATIEVWSYQGDAPYKHLQTISTLKDGVSGSGDCAAIKISQDGRHLYASIRGAFNNIAIFNVQLDGKLVLIGHESTKGETPRDFEISPDGKYLIVANQNSDNLITFEIDPKNGSLGNGQETKGILTPVCIKFL